MEQTKNADRELVARFYDEVLNGKRLEVIDELVTPDFVEHGTPPIEGSDGFRSFVDGLLGALPDLRFTAEDWIVEGDRVVARCSGTGTHRGELFGYPSTGRQVSWTAIHIWRVVDGRLAERWSEANLLGLVEQLKG